MEFAEGREAMRADLAPSASGEARSVICFAGQDGCWRYVLVNQLTRLVLDRGGGRHGLGRRIKPVLPLR